MQSWRPCDCHVLAVWILGNASPGRVVTAAMLVINCLKMAGRFGFSPAVSTKKLVRCIGHCFQGLGLSRTASKYPITWVHIAHNHQVIRHHQQLRRKMLIYSQSLQRAARMTCNGFHKQDPVQAATIGLNAMTVPYRVLMLHHSQSARVCFTWACSNRVHEYSLYDSIISRWHAGPDYMCAKQIRWQKLCQGTFWWKSTVAHCNACRHLVAPVGYH